MQLSAQQLSKNHYFILTFAACISLIISIVDNTNTHVLNSDSLLYLYTAQAFLDHGLQAAVDIYSWPLLSILIAGMHQLTGLSLALSGHLLIAFLYAGLTCVFVSLVRDLGGSSRTQLLALLVIIIFPTLNDYRSYITRDAGFWLFTLLSLQQLLRFALHTHYKHALGWFLFTLAAIGFRTEAIFFAALAPLAILFDRQLSPKQRLKMTGSLYGLFSCVAIVVLIVIFITPSLVEKTKLFYELFDIPALLHNGYMEYQKTINNWASVKPYIHFVEDINTIFITGLIGLVLYTILHVLALPYLVLLCWPSGTKHLIPPSKKIYLAAYLLPILSYLMLKTFHGHFTTDRYCLIAVLLIMLALPFNIEAIWNKASISQGRFNWQKTLIVLLLIYPALDSFITSGSSKKYLADATEWVSNNTPADAHFATNEEHIAVIGANCLRSCFRKNADTIITLARNQQADFIAIKLKHKEQQVLQEINLLLASPSWTLLQTFSNKKDDKVLILARNTHINTALSTD